MYGLKKILAPDLLHSILPHQNLPHRLFLKFLLLNLCGNKIRFCLRIQISKSAPKRGFESIGENLFISSMTEYWVSQGKKWCDFCKIFIANNPLSIRTHDLGERHKESVAKRLSSMRKESAAKDKEQKNAARALEQIEEKAKQSYQRDLASFDSGAQQKKPDSVKFTAKDGWEHDAASGYYCNLAKGYYYDPKSGLFYTNEIGKWVTEEEAFKTSSNSGSSSSGSKPKSLNPMRSVKGAPSSIAVNKRKRENEKPKAVSKEEAEALRAREAAKKRVEAREKPLMGLYNAYKF